MAQARDFDVAEYLDSPEAIAAYLSEALETGDDSLVAQALGSVARVKGTKAAAEETGLNRENLYRSLSEGGRPELGTVMKVLDALDVQLVASPRTRTERPLSEAARSPALACTLVISSSDAYAEALATSVRTQP